MTQCAKQNKSLLQWLNATNKIEKNTQYLCGMWQNNCKKKKNLLSYLNSTTTFKLLRGTLLEKLQKKTAFKMTLLRNYYILSFSLNFSYIINSLKVRQNKCALMRPYFFLLHSILHLHQRHYPSSLRISSRITPGVLRTHSNVKWAFGPVNLFSLSSPRLMVGLMPTASNCQSPDFKGPIGPTKNLERLYNRVVGCLVVCSVVRLQRWL